MTLTEFFLMSSRILLSITLSTLLLMFVVTLAVQVADGHGGAGAPGHKKVKDKSCAESLCIEDNIEIVEKKFCFLFWCF